MVTPCWLSLAPAGLLMVALVTHTVVAVRARAAHARRHNRPLRHCVPAGTFHHLNRFLCCPETLHFCLICYSRPDFLIPVCAKPHFGSGFQFGDDFLTAQQRNLSALNSGLRAFSAMAFSMKYSKRSWQSVQLPLLIWYCSFMFSILLPPQICCFIWVNYCTLCISCQSFILQRAFFFYAGNGGKRIITTPRNRTPLRYAVQGAAVIVPCQ